MNDKTTGTQGANGDPGQAGQAKRAQAGAEAATGGARKRGGTRAEERIAALDTTAATLTEQVEQLTAELEAAEQRAAEAEAGWQRARADFANLKRRTEEERADLAGQASDRLLVRVLDLADDFDLAVEHVPEGERDSPWVEGIAAIDRKLRTLLESEGITTMEVEGLPFDPHTQQAISYEDTDDLPDGTVIKVLQRGYAIRDRVLRPALVAVARNDEPTAAEPGAVDLDDDDEEDDD